MKLTTVFLLAACLQVSAKSFSQTITVNESNVPLQRIFSVISQRTGYQFLYADEVLLNAKKVSVHMQNGTVEDVLGACLTGQQLDFVVSGNTIIIKRKPVPVPVSSLAAAPFMEVRGRVTDESGNPVEGVSVVNVKSGKGTTTNPNGAYVLQAEAGDVLRFSYVGRQSQTVKILEGKTVYDLVLPVANPEMSNLVVTALGVRRQEKALGYATQSVKGSTLQTVKGVDVATSLTGKIAGMTVKNSSEFFAEPDVTLRGEKPLIVVDGVPYGNLTLRDIPADDIESINVLKGATASALYGERGGSGAIMITTKKSAANKGLSVSVNTSSMFTAGYLAIPERQSQYGRVINTATNTYALSGDGAWGAPMEGQNVIQWDPVSKSMKEMPYLPIGKDNFKNFLQQGYILNHNLSIAQAGEMGGFRASATWVDNRGTYPNSRFEKITYSVGGDIKIQKFSLTTSLSYNKHSSPNIGFNGYTGYDPMYSLLIWSAPDWNILDYKDYWQVPNEVQNSSYTAGNNNPYFDRYERIHSYNKDMFNGQLTLTYDVLNWLKATVRTGYDNYSIKQDIRISKGSFQGGGNSTVIPGGTEIWGESKKGSFNTGLSRGFSTNTEGLLLANKKISDFSIDGFAGASLFYMQNEGMEARTQSGLTIPGYYSLKSSVSPVNVQSLISQKQTNSVFAKAGVSWRNLAFLEGTFRNDWASTLAKSTRSYFYPSAAGSLVLSDLLPKQKWLSFWKVRGSWTMYKTPASVYAINDVYAIATNQWGTLGTASYPTTIRPDDLFPEASTTTEVGTFASFLQNRASLDVTLYKKRMYDFLVTSSISPASGYLKVYTNSQEEQARKGVELVLNATPVKNNDFRWNVSLNWTKYATYFTKLDSQYSVKGRSWVEVGKRTDYYIYNEYQTDNNGNLVFNNGVPTYKPIQSLAGYSDPDWVWGASTSLNYKRLTLNVAIDGRVGGLAQSLTEMYMWRSGNHPNSLTEARYLDAKTPGSKNYLGEGVMVVSGAITYDANNNVVSDTRVFAPNDVYTTYKSYLEALHKGTAWGGSPSPADLYSTTFLKVREVSLSYALPGQWIKKIGAKNILLSAVGQNLFYWAKQFKYSDIDGGTENFADPSLRYIGFNLKVDF